MPVEFLTGEQAAGYATFRGAPSRSALERFFFLDDADRELVESKRRAHNRLGFAVQLTTVRFLGVFPEGALGLVLNALVLFNARYMDAALTQLSADGFDVRGQDVARLSAVRPAPREHGGPLFLPAPRLSRRDAAAA